MHVKIYLLFFFCMFHFIAVCNEENTISDQFGSYFWPMTIAGDTHLERCVFRAGYNASRTCSQEASWIAVNFVDCRMSKCLVCMYNANSAKINDNRFLSVPVPLRNQTLYVRFSSSPNGIFTSQSIQAALRTVENVVYAYTVKMCVLQQTLKLVIFGTHGQ